MATAKIDVKIGQIEFSGEGDQDWIAKQLDKILSQAEKLVSLVPKVEEKNGNGGQETVLTDNAIAKKTLPSFLQEKSATTNDVKRFLVTAVWLEARGKNRMQTGDVSDALRLANQAKLPNAASCLSRNIGKGFCEKDGAQFFVTSEGKNSLGA